MTAAPRFTYPRLYEPEWSPGCSRCDLYPSQCQCNRWGLPALVLG